MDGRVDEWKDGWRHEATHKCNLVFKIAFVRGWGVAAWLNHLMDECVNGWIGEDTKQYQVQCFVWWLRFLFYYVTRAVPLLYHYHYYYHYCITTTTTITTSTLFYPLASTISFCRLLVHRIAVPCVSMQRNESSYVAMHWLKMHSIKMCTESKFKHRETKIQNYTELKCTQQVAVHSFKMHSIKMYKNQNVRLDRPRSCFKIIPLPISTYGNTDWDSEHRETEILN
jgi:hypothetical protein